MNIDIKPKIGNWQLVVGPRAIVPTLLKMIKEAARDTYQVQMTAPAPFPVKLF